MSLRQYQQLPSVPPIQETPTRVPSGNSARRAGNDVAHDLMSGNQRGALTRQLAFGDVQIGAADPASADFQQNLSGCQLWLRNLF